MEYWYKKITLEANLATTCQIHIIKFQKRNKILANQQNKSRQSKSKSKTEDLVFNKIRMSNPPALPPSSLEKFQRSRIELQFQNKSC